jgi:hypothetical protein
MQHYAQIGAQSCGLRAVEFLFEGRRTRVAAIAFFVGGEMSEFSRPRAHVICEDGPRSEALDFAIFAGGLASVLWKSHEHVTVGGDIYQQWRRAGTWDMEEEFESGTDTNPPFHGKEPGARGPSLPLRNLLFVPSTSL